jgi:hypothetical protein
MESFMRVCEGVSEGMTALKVSLIQHLTLYEFSLGEQMVSLLLQYRQRRCACEFEDYIMNYNAYLLKLGLGIRVFYAAKVGEFPSE